MQKDKENFEIWKSSLTKAKSKLKTAENILHMVIPLKDNRLMIKALTFLSESSSLIITSILQKECLNNNLKLYSNQEKNLKVFFNLVNKYLEKKDIENIATLMRIRREHIRSHLEFIKQDKFVIFLGERYEVVTLELIKKLMSSVEILILKIERTSGKEKDI